MTGTLGNACFSFLCIDDSRTLPPIVGCPITLAGPCASVLVPDRSIREMISTAIAIARSLCGEVRDWTSIQFPSLPDILWIILLNSSSAWLFALWRLRTTSPFLVLVHRFTSLNSILFSVRSSILVRRSCVCIRIFSTHTWIPSIFNAILLGLACASRAEQRKRPSNHCKTVQEVKVLVTRWLAD